MSLSPSEAADSLKQIEKAGRRSAEAHIYANASPFFIMWGVLWVIGYAGSDLIIATTGTYRFISLLWIAISLVGAAGSTLIGRRQHLLQHPGMREAGRAKGRRWWLTFFAAWVFLLASLVVLKPANAIATGAFVPLLVALVYTIYGIWGGMRFLYTGIAVAALTLGGWFYLPQHFLLWMAFVGGGSLILVGLWLKKV